MPIYYSDTVRSKLTVRGELSPLNIVELSSPPSNPVEHDMYLDDGTNTASGDPGWRRYNGVAWEDVAAAAGGSASAFVDLTDGPGSYTTPYAVHRLNSTPDGIEESPVSLITVGTNNHFFGDGAGASDYSGEDSVAIGPNAFSAGSNAADACIAIGRDVLALQVGPYGNSVGIGPGSLDASVSGFENIAIGPDAAGKLTSAYGTIAIGRFAAENITTSNRITAIGLYAAQNTTEGAQVAIGAQALQRVLGGGNCVIGYQSGYGAASATAYNNTGLGNYTLNAIDDGYENIAIGYSSMRYCTSSALNVAIGAYSLNAAGAGNANIAIGWGTLAACTDSYNIGMGAYVMNVGTSITGNIGIGFSALRDLTFGDRNVTMGYESGRHQTTTTDFVAIGYRAARYITGGGNATNLTQGIYIGSGTVSSAASVANEIAIGYGAIGAGANTVTIGNTSTTDNYFTGTVHASTGYQVAATPGISGTYSFGGGGTGDIATMTFVGGILTAVTTVP